MEGVRRNGRSPSDLVALLKEQVGDITIEDILTAHFLAEMPQSVRSQLNDKVDTLSLEELAKAADMHFNQDGTLRASQSQVNSVASQLETTQASLSTPTSFTAPFEDNSLPNTDVNYINRRAPRNSRGSNNRNSYDNNNSRSSSNSNSNSRPRNTPSNARGGRNRSSSRTNSSNPSNSNPNWCWVHNKFGDDARTCKPPCAHPKSAATQQQQQQGNARGGRR